MNVFDVMLDCMPLEETIRFLRLVISGKLNLLMSLGVIYLCTTAIISLSFNPAPHMIHEFNFRFKIYFKNRTTVNINEKGEDSNVIGLSLSTVNLIILLKKAIYKMASMMRGIYSI